MANLVHELLLESVCKYGDTLVFKDKHSSMTRRELDNFSNQTANFLLKMGVEKGDRIALLMETSTYAAALVFGVMKSGAIYVPIHTHSPQVVIHSILQEIAPKIIVMDCKYADQITACDYVKENRPTLLLNTFEDVSSRWAQCYHLRDIGTYEAKAVMDPPRIIARDLVCIIYTSGTSGRPKGVMCRHENLMPFFRYVAKAFRHDEHSVTMSRSPLSFDPYLTEIIPNLVGGGRVVFYSFTSLSAFLKIVEKERIKDFSCPPSLINLLVNNPELLQKFDLSSLEELWIGYEFCSIDSVRKLQAVFAQVRIIHGYGTTETFASSAFHEVETISAQWPSLPIGKPIDGTELLIIDESGKRAAPGTVGEMVIRGSSVMAGYWRDEQATKRSFRKHPLFAHHHETVYYTGDMFCCDEDGHYFYIGRNDDQVKINGYRVELMEIKTSVMAADCVLDCQPISVQCNGVDKIVCYTVSRNGIRDLREIQQHCKLHLATHKIPGTFLFVDAIAQNANGKISVSKLREHYLANHSD